MEQTERSSSRWWATRRVSAAWASLVALWCAALICSIPTRSWADPKPALVQRDGMPNTQLSSVGLAPGSEAGKVRLYNSGNTYYQDISTSPSLTGNRSVYVPNDSGTVLLDSTVGALFLSRNPRVLYVSTGGSDVDGDGSISYPYASVTAAMAAVVETSVILMAPGSYAAATVSNSGTAPVDLTPSIDVVLAGVPGQTVVTLSGSASGPGVYNVLKISGASGVRFERTGTGNRHAICGMDSQIGLNECELYNTDGSRKLTAFGRTGESAPARGLKISGSAQSQIELYNIWLRDCVLEVDFLNLLQFSGEISNRISNSIIEATTNGDIVISGLSSMNDVTFLGSDVDSFSVSLSSYDAIAYYRDVTVRLGCSSSASTGDTAVFSWNGVLSDVPAILDGWDVEWTGLFAEPASGGKVSLFRRFSGTKEIAVRNSRFISTGICILNSHPNPANDPNRTTEDRPMTLENCLLATTRAATTGPADVNGPLLNYGRGAFRSSGNIYRGTMAASTNAATFYAAFYHSPPNAGAMNVTSTNDRFESTLPAGVITVSGATSNEKAVINIQNVYTTVTARIVNPTFNLDGNQTSIFAGHGIPYVTVEGLIGCDDAITFENAPAGSYQAVRGDLMVSGDASVGDDLVVTGEATTTDLLTADQPHFRYQTELSTGDDGNYMSLIEFGKDDGGVAYNGTPFSLQWNIAGGYMEFRDSNVLGGGSPLSFLGGIISGLYYVSSVSTGTAPMVVASTTKVTNLNADRLDGNDWTAPGTIGGTTPGSATFTTLAATARTSMTGVKGGYRSVSSAATVDPQTDFTIMQTGTTITQAVPTTGVVTGQIFVFAVSRTGSHDRAVTLDAEGGATIGGEATWPLRYPGEVLMIQFDGTNYQVIGRLGGYTGTIPYLDPDSAPNFMTISDGLVISYEAI